MCEFLWLLVLTGRAGDRSRGVSYVEWLYAIGDPGNIVPCWLDGRERVGIK